jgi:phage terminase small subunit
MSAVVTKPKRRRSRKYSAEPLAVVPNDADLGPAMLALTPKQRRFVLELRHGPAGYGSEVRAARAAGYGTRSSSDLSMRVLAHQSLHNPRVQDALREVGGKIIRAEAFQSIKTTTAIAHDLTHKDCLKANLALLDRGGFAIETHHLVTVEHKIDYQKQALEELAAFRRLGVVRETLEQIFGRDGLYHLEQQLDASKPKMIEGELSTEQP